MGRMKLLDKIKNGSANQVEGHCIVKSVQQRSNVKGSDYLDFVLADAWGEISAKLWDYDMEQHGVYYPGSIIKVRATLTQWKDIAQLKIDRIRKAEENEEIDMSELVPSAPFEPEAMYAEVFDCAEKFENNDLKLITQYLLKENKPDLLKYPAALKLHHSMQGGLLYHVVTMLRAAKGICAVYKPLYPALNCDLVFAGIILHDIAKTGELTIGDLGLAAAYSVKGHLLGHISMGMAMLERASAELMIDEQVATLLQHVLLSHHGIPEYGSPRPTMFPEAEIVSLLDLLDARLFEMYDALDTVAEGEFTERQWALDNRQLFKHGF